MISAWDPAGGHTVYKAEGEAHRRNRLRIPAPLDWAHWMIHLMCAFNVRGILSFFTKLTPLYFFSPWPLRLAVNFVKASFPDVAQTDWVSIPPLWAGSEGSAPRCITVTGCQCGYSLLLCHQPANLQYVTFKNTLGYTMQNNTTQTHMIHIHKPCIILSDHLAWVMAH